MPAYRVTTRSGAKVTREPAATVDAALELLESNARAIADSARTGGVGGTLMRRVTPVQRVIGRIELRGPRRLRAGVDVRGDGSSEAFTGRLRRAVVAQRTGETSFDALRRELGR